MTLLPRLHRPLYVLVTLIVFGLFAGSLIAVATAAEGTEKSPPRIALFPFKVNAAQDMGYLKNGIRDMLATRLSANVGAQIISNVKIAEILAARNIADPGMMPPEALKELGTALGADFLVSGSVTALGSSMSLDARTVPMAEGREPQTFYSTAPKEDDVLLAINQMAWDISDQVFGRKKPAETAQVGGASAPDPGAQELSSFQTAHPDRAFLHPSSGGKYGPRSPFVQPRGIGSALGFNKTQNLNMTIQAMDIGDVDGDGKDDMVLATADEVFFYHIVENRLTEFKKISLGARYKVHAITIANLNENSVNEVYISAADTQAPYSFGLEWQGSDFTYLFKKEPWYVRALKIGRGQTVLAGQKAGVSELFQSGIYELEVVNNSLKAGQKLPVHSWLNLFDFSLADLDGDAQPEIIAISQSDRMMVLRQMGQMLWQSQDPFGGSKEYIGELRDLQRTGANMDDGHAADGMKGVAERVYIQPRIIIADINNDEVEDVIYLQNKSISNRVTAHLKGFNSSEVYGLAWSGIGLAELWRTRKVDGYIAEIQFRRNPEDPTKGTLYVAVHLGGGGSLGSLSASQSTVLIYPMDFSDAEQLPRE